MKLSKREVEVIDEGLEITFMHIKEIMKNPKLLDKYTDNTTFFPVYLKDKDREALLVGVRPGKTAADHSGNS